MPNQPDCQTLVPLLSRVRSGLDARAAGLWWVEGESLLQLAFDAALDMPCDVAADFARVTQVVSLLSRPFGIVAAATQGCLAVSIASELAADVGSGFWLRAFKAQRSIAVPLIEGTRVFAVVAVALAELDRSASAIEETLRAEAMRWFSAERTDRL